MWLTIEEPNTESRRIEINGQHVSVGRDSHNDLVLTDPQVSSRHALLEIRGDGTIELRDLQSTNGTVVNGQKISGPVELRNGERISLGKTVLILDGEAAGETKLAADPTDVGAFGEPDRRWQAQDFAGAAPPQQQAAPAPAPAPAPPPQQQAPPPPAPPQPQAPPGFQPQPGFQQPAPGFQQQQQPGYAPPARPSVVMRGASAVWGGARRGQSTVIRRMQQTTRRALWFAVGAVVVAIIAVGVGVAAVLGVFSSSKSQPSVASVAHAVQPSTIYVEGQANGQAVESGSGWVLNAGQGLIVTNDHVAEGAPTMKVGMSTGAPATASRDAKIVATAPCDDVALLRTSDTSGLQTLPLSSQSQLKAGDGVVALGYPGTASSANNLIVTSGTISNPQVQFSAQQAQAADIPNLPNVIQTDTVINPGNSGGPLVNFNKQLVGMNTAGLSQLGGRSIQGENYAIGVDRIKTVVSQLENGHSIGSAGFILNYDSQGQSQGGIQIQGVVDGSPASQLGLDFSGSQSPTLVAINGQQLSGSKADYCSAVQGIGAGQNATVSIADPTAGQVQNYNVTFG